MKEIKMPSGAILRIASATFEVSKALYQQILKETKEIKMGAGTDLASVYKDLFCIGFSSKEIETCLWECFKHCTYNNGKGDLRITKDTFEPVAARDDYLTVCMEVTKENTLPFVKSLYAEYVPILRTLINVQP